MLRKKAKGELLSELWQGFALETLNWIVGPHTINDPQQAKRNRTMAAVR